MRSPLRTLGLSLIALVVAGCGRIEVRTMTAPGAGFSGMHTFRMLTPARRELLPPAPTDDPMIANSIAYRALSDQVVASFTARGYARDQKDADFAVAFYASAREQLDVSAWDYGYPFHPEWRAPAGMAPFTTTYREGSVIVDVLRSGDRALLWRGEGRARLTDDPNENVRELARAAREIINRFPASTVVNVVASR